MTNTTTPGTSFDKRWQLFASGFREGSVQWWDLSDSVCFWSAFLRLLHLLPVVPLLCHCCATVVPLLCHCCATCATFQVWSHRSCPSHDRLPGGAPNCRNWKQNQRLSGQAEEYFEWGPQSVEVGHYQPFPWHFLDFCSVASIVFCVRRWLQQETLGGCSQVACVVCPFAVASVQSIYFKKNSKEVLNAQKSQENGQTHSATESYADDWQTQWQ